MTAAVALTGAGCSAAPAAVPPAAANVTSADPAAEKQTARDAIASAASAITGMTGTTWEDAEEDTSVVVACSKADAAVHRSTRLLTKTLGTALATEQFDEVLAGAARALAVHGYARQVIAARYPNTLDAIWRNPQGALIRLDSSEALTLSATSSCWPDAAYDGTGKVKKLP